MRHALAGLALRELLGQAPNPPKVFFAGSSLDFTSRTFHYRQYSDFYNTKDLTQSLMLDYSSGFTQGTLRG